MSSSIQSIKNKIGEVTFRKKLALQFEGKASFYPGEPTKTEYKTILKERIKAYTQYFQRLKDSNITLAPYLELGGGVGQGAMLLENRFNIRGFTCDISYETIRLSNKYLKLLEFKKMPIRICCDIYNLPFQTSSIPFIFIFQTLHHLPDPKPVLAEAKRVLSPGGYIYVNEEPVSQAVNLNLWRRDRNLRWFEKILKAAIVLHFISRIGKSEVEHNILEETFSLNAWERALNIFSSVDANLIVFPFGPTIQRKKNSHKRWLAPPLLQNAMLQILGGGIEALCQKENSKRQYKHDKLFDLLACPNCSHKPTLYYQRSKGVLFCNSCKSKFKERNGIFMLLSTSQQKSLYP